MIGITYSVASYEGYKESGNANIFEEVIDDLMIDKYSDDNELTEYIKSLSREDKRMAILSLLDGDNNLWVKLKSMINGGLTKMEHIKDVVIMLRDYVKVGDVEKKKFGEVMTPLELVKEMLATLPEDVWTNPDLKWLDPANGTGPFPIMVIYKLMKGLENWEPDDEKRYKHIVENMIYTCELQSRNVFLWLCAVDPKDEYLTNTYWGSFLEDGFDKHMKDVWDVEKFDIVIGNPPYNGSVTDSGNSTDIYDTFIIKSSNISSYVCMVTPSKWFFKHDKRTLRNFMVNSGRLYYINTQNKYFEDINIRGGVSFFLLNDSFNYFVIFDNYKVDLMSQYKINGFIIKDQSNHKTISNILNKISKQHKLSSIFNSSSYFGLNTNFNNISNSGNKCYFSSRQKNKLGLFLDENNNRYFSYVDTFKDIKSKVDKWKLMTTKAYGYKTNSQNTYNRIGDTFICKPGEICTQTYVFFDFDTEQECVYLQSYIKTNFVKYLISLIKVKQDVTSKIFDIVPMVPFDREWKDEMLYEYFDLTQEEINLIEKTVK